MEEIQKLTKIVENYFRETKIRSFRATKINKNRELIFKDNYCQLGCQLSSIHRLTFVFAQKNAKTCIDGQTQNHSTPYYTILHHSKPSYTTLHRQISYPIYKHLYPIYKIPNGWANYWLSTTYKNGYPIMRGKHCEKKF